MSTLITNQCFLKALDKQNLGNKSVSWKNIVTALKSLEIIVLPEPTDKKSLSIWRAQKHKIDFNVKRIRKNRAKQKKNITDYQVKGILVDIADYKELLRVMLPTDMIDDDDKNWEDIEECDKNDLPKTQIGRPKVNLKYLSTQQVRKRTNSIYELLLKFLKKENVSMSWLVSILARRYYNTPSEHYDYNLGSMFDMIVKGVNPFKSKIVPTDKAIYLKSMFKAGRRKFTIKKQLLKPYCKIPGPLAIRKREEEIRPKITETLNDGVMFKMAEVIPLHVKGLLEDLASPIEKVPSHITAKINFGFDGSGRHHEFRSVKTDSENIILVGFRVSTIESGHYDDSDVLYEEMSQAEYTEVPLRVVPGKETDCLVEKLWTELEQEAKMCNQSDFPITVNGHETILNPVMEFTQADRAVLDKICGCRGAFCLNCLASIESGNSIEKIKEGFPLDRNLNDMHALFPHIYNSYNCQNLEDFKKLDSATRQGLSHQPMGEGYFKVNRLVPPLHTELNTLKLFQELAYSLNSRDVYEENGGEIFRGQGKKRTKKQKDAKKLAKANFQTKSKSECNLPLDM